MASRLPLYRTKELSEETWPDFERLFSRGHGWDHCWCMAFQRGRRPSRKEFRTRAEVGVVNHQHKKALLDQGRAHGILVYADGEPIGWCQYGPGDELGGPIGRPPAPIPSERTQLWRVTCFVVDRKHRRQGVAGLALRAALESIRTRGGGLVEAYPVTHWSHGRDASQGVMYVQGVGPVGPAWGGFGNVSTSGVVSMFEKEGFQAVSVCGSASKRIRNLGASGCQVLMRLHTPT
jgi:GNAT superfamily N-acetyltransferase